MSGSSSKNSKYGPSGSHKHSKSSLAQSLADGDTGGIVHIPFQRTTSKQFSTYNAALLRSADDCLAVEDLDNIQLELEQLLSNVAIRYRILKSEYESIDKDDRRNERKHKHNEKQQPASPAPSTSAGSVSKRKRDEGGSVRKPKHSSSTLKHSKSKNSPIALHTDDSMEYVAPVVHTSHPHGPNRDHHLQKLPLPKNDTPNKFWLSVEPYCMPITNEDLRMIDDLLEQYAGPLVPAIPELGPHYTNTWSVDDLKDIQQNSNPNAHGNRLKPLNNSEAVNMLKKAENIVEEETITGSLTQRLVSALMEEQLLQQNPAELIADCSNSSSENTLSSSQSNFKSLSMLKNCVGIEKRLKKELIEQGILDLGDFPNDDKDEILSEIKHLVSELSAIAEYNSTSLRRLREAAVDEMKRLEIKRKLDIVDQEILETYKRTMQNKAKKKPLAPEEQLEIIRLTTEQKTLSEQLEQSQAAAVIFE